MYVMAEKIENNTKCHNNHNLFFFLVLVDILKNFLFYINIL